MQATLPAISTMNFPRSLDLFSKNSIQVNLRDSNGVGRPLMVIKTE